MQTFVRTEPMYIQSIFEFKYRLIINVMLSRNVKYIPSCSLNGHLLQQLKVFQIIHSDPYFVLRIHLAPRRSVPLHSA